MPALLFTALALAAALPPAALAARHQRRHRTARDPLAQAFAGREFRHFDAHLHTIAGHERHRLDQELARYLAGPAGHVVVVRKAPHGVALELSDGRQLALAGISTRTAELINHHGPRDKLRPAHLDRDIFSCRLLLRGATGTELSIYARTITLAA